MPRTGDVILAMSIDAAVESDGDMQVVQTARYQFETEGNGFYIDFDFELDGAVTVEESSSGDWVEYTQRSSASNGERGVFTLEGNRLKIPTIPPRVGKRPLSAFATVSAMRPSGMPTRPSSTGR